MGEGHIHSIAWYAHVLMRLAAIAGNVGLTSVVVCVDLSSGLS